MNLINMLSLPASGLVCITGSGGKTSLLNMLAQELSQNNKKVVVCATTKMYPPENMPVLLSPSPHDIADAFKTSNPICAGDMLENGKLTLNKTSVNMLAANADYVIAEADGSAGLPLKAHAEYEPVIPGTTGLVITVAGIDGIGRSISNAAHRPEIYAKILGCGTSHIITPKDAAQVLNYENHEDIVFINKADTKILCDKAEELASHLHKHAIIASLKQRSAEYAGSYKGRG